MGSLFVFSDKVKVRQILRHLLSNAFKFTESGEIEFVYKVTEEDIEFYINDTGKGMSEEALSQIFNWISVSDMESSKITKGFGIPISKAYIDLLGGDMSITSLLEKGTSVKIRIPIKGKAYKEQKTLEYSNKAIDLSSYIILVAEDEKIN
jgi:signal transduction histidine kinase